MSEPSLFKRLFISLSGLLLLLFCLSSVLIYYSISEHLNNAKDKEMVTNSHILWNIMKDELGSKQPNEPGSKARRPSLNDKINKTLLPNSEWQAIRIWKDHALIFKSGNPDSQDAPAAKPDFSDKKRGDEAWRTYAFYIQEENIVIEVSENLLSRKVVVRSIFEGFLESSMLLIPLLALLLFLCLRFGMRGLTDMEKLLEERGPQSLGHISIDTIPKELKPLQRAINFLLGKLRDNLAHEKQLIDNTAHELRTPLATLKLHAQLASDATNEKDRAESMEDLFSTIDRTTQLVEQLLALSRTAMEQVVKKPVSLYDAAAKVLREHLPEAERKRIQLNLTGDKQAKPTSHEELLGILLGVLLDNAIKYSPDYGAVMMNISHDTLEITDSGPGIPQEEREKVFERFYRGKHGIQGNGLGLAIAKQICEMLDIAIELADVPGSNGLLVRLSFPKR
jgi:signal transduction histidine kinase